MNRIDRVTAILIQLQSRNVVKAQDIAERFDIKVSASGAQRESIVFNLPRDWRTVPAA